MKLRSTFLFVNSKLVYPDIILQIFQPCFKIVYLCSGIIIVREAQQISLASLVKTNNAIQARHLRHFHQRVIVIVVRANIKIHRQTSSILLVLLYGGWKN